jgi:putative hemolysin
MVDELLIILILIVSNGLLSMAEIAIISSKRSRLEAQAKKGSRGAKTALELSSKPSRFLSTVQIGITVTGILTGIFSGKSLILWFNQLLIDAGIDVVTANWIAFPSTVIVITFFSLVIGELVPKRIGMHNPERIASSLAPLMNGISKLVSPLIWLLSGTTDGILRIFGIDSKAEEVQVTEEEVKELIAQGTNSGTIEELEQDMMERVLLLGDRSVASLMTNRIEVEWIDVNAETQDILEKIVESNHSLFPVCDDEIDKVVGVLSSKKFLVALQREKMANIRYLMDNARVIPENMKALAALEEFKANKTKIAVVVDEYGSVQGVLTQSDLFESIVAEHDTPDEENEISIIQREENSYLIDALLPFEEFLQYFEIDDVATEDRTGFHSLGGFILHLSKQIPSTGDRFEWKNYEFEVVDMDVNRIDKLMVTIKDEEVGS